MMAAYNQGAAGEFLKMRNMLQDVATKSNESSRTILDDLVFEQER